MVRILLLSTSLLQLIAFLYFIPTVKAMPQHLNHLSKRATPFCLGTMGHPPLEHCKVALESFWTHMVIVRAYEVDEEIEFLAPGAEPLQAHRMPREIMSPHLYTFQGSNILRTSVPKKAFLAPLDLLRVYPDDTNASTVH